MSENTPRLSLPLILPNQAQKHVTHNEAIARLDAVVQLAVAGFDATTPPAAPVEGDIWALGPAPVQDWDGQGGQLAVFQNGGWVFIAPSVGWLAVGQGTLDLRVWSGTQWEVHEAGDMNNVAGVGINTSFDATNALAVSAPATLLTHEGTGGHQLKLNKAAAGDTASLVFQSDWTGYAEMGLAGSNDFAIKVSDGTNWYSGLTVSGSNGQVGIASGLEVDGALTGTAVMQGLDDATAGRVMTVGAFGVGTITPPFIADIDTASNLTGIFHTSPQTLGTFPTGQKYGHLLQTQRSGSDRVQQFWNVLEDVMFQRRYRTAEGGWQPWQRYLNSVNTTEDANGFIKAASPIVRLLSDGVTEPVEPVGAQFSRNDVGQYVLSDVEPLSDSGWQIEVPQDHNGNRLVFVTTDYDADARILSVNTRAVVWDSQRGVWAGGDFIDIPEGRWVDLRFQRPPSDDGQEPDTVAE